MGAASDQALAEARHAFNARVGDIRPRLHRYAARMTGSAIDAEDIVQDALAKAYYQLPDTVVENLQAWLMRIVHNKAIDLLRRASASPVMTVDELPETVDVQQPLEARETAAYAMSVFLRLTPLQRSCVILKDVLGYSLEEISETLDTAVGAVKSALHRGRANLRRIAATAEVPAVRPLPEREAGLLRRYVDRFNARDFDALRAMLADDVRLELAEKLRARGAAQVGAYYGNYDRVFDWRMEAGLVEGRPAVLARDPADPDTIAYFILLEWTGDGRVRSIRDYRYVRYVAESAEMSDLQAATGEM